MKIPWMVKVHTVILFQFRPGCGGGKSRLLGRTGSWAGGGPPPPPPGSALDPRPSAAYIPAPALRRDSVILSTEDDTLGDFCAGHSAAAEVLLHRTRQWYNCTEVNQATRRIQQGTRVKTGES